MSSINNGNATDGAAGLINQVAAEYGAVGPGR
jgi:hypothetical protein